MSVKQSRREKNDKYGVENSFVIGIIFVRNNFFDLLFLFLFVFSFESFSVEGEKKMNIISYVVILCCWIIFFAGLLWFFTEVVSPPMTGDRFTRICRDTGGVPQGEVCVCGKTIIMYTENWKGCYG